MKSFKFPLKQIAVVFFLMTVLFSCANDDTTDDNTTDDDTPTTTADGDILLTDNLIVDKSKAFVNYTLSTSEYEKYINEEGNVRDITKEIYTHFNDDYDLIIILGVENEKPAGTAFGFNTLAKNEIEGLGGITFNSTEGFGSAGRLNGVIFMPLTEYVSNGPFLHEIAHLWANKGFIPTTVSGHWGYSSIGGQLGGFDTLTDLGNNTYKATVADRTSFGTFANGGNSLPYSNIELYLMGLASESGLEPVLVAINPIAGSTSGEFTADEIKTYSVAELLEINGKRVPAFEDAQKEFTALTVVISPEDAVLPEAKKNDIINRLDDFFKEGDPSFSTYNFWTATNESAIIKNEIALDSFQ